MSMVKRVASAITSSNSITPRIIPVAILALDALGLESVSAPASDTLRLILNAIPQIVGAALLLGIGYLLSTTRRFRFCCLANRSCIAASDAATASVGLISHPARVLEQSRP